MAALEVLGVSLKDWKAALAVHSQCLIGVSMQVVYPKSCPVQLISGLVVVIISSLYWETFGLQAF